MTSNIKLGKKLGLATHNEGKRVELENLLSPLGFIIATAKQKAVPEPEETGSSFTENALLKARHMADQTGEAALADDSGLCVLELDGAPGIFSARWAGKDKQFSSAMSRIHDELVSRNITPNGAEACFTCVIAICDEAGNHITFEGNVDGTLVFPPRGAEGFGYDPIFQPRGYNKTFAQMSSKEKHGLDQNGNGLSHRARAITKMMQWLSEHPVKTTP